MQPSQKQKTRPFHHFPHVSLSPILDFLKNGLEKKKNLTPKSCLASTPSMIKKKNKKFEKKHEFTATIGFTEISA